MYHMYIVFVMFCRSIAWMLTGVFVNLVFLLKVSAQWYTFFCLKWETNTPSSSQGACSQLTREPDCVVGLKGKWSSTQTLFKTIKRSCGILSKSDECFKCDLKSLVCFWEKNIPSIVMKESSLHNLWLYFTWVAFRVVVQKRTKFVLRDFLKPLSLSS